MGGHHPNKLSRRTDQWSRLHRSHVGAQQHFSRTAGENRIRSHIRLHDARLLVHRRTAGTAFVISDRVKVVQEFILEAGLRRNSQHALG
jgi:hypothetical protein